MEPLDKYFCVIYSYITTHYLFLPGSIRLDLVFPSNFPSYYMYCATMVESDHTLLHNCYLYVPRNPQNFQYSVKKLNLAVQKFQGPVQKFQGPRLYDFAFVIYVIRKCWNNKLGIFLKHLCIKHQPKPVYHVLHRIQQHSVPHRNMINECQ